MLIFLDRQHAGKPKRVSDRGAGQDINGDGLISWAEKEAIWTGKLSLELEILLLELGYNVIPISDGSYAERHKRVNNYAIGSLDSIYLALHLNAGGGDYGSFFYHHSSVNGKQLAEEISLELQKNIQLLKRVKPISCQGTDWTKNAYYTIKGVGRPVAICCEPIFMDTHQELLTDNGMKQIALGISQGVKNWIMR